MSVLIVSNRIDPHSDEVVRALAQRGVEVFRFNTEDFCESTSFAVEAEASGFATTLRTPTRSVRFDAIRSVLYRRPKPSLAETIEEDHARRFVEAERATALRWLWQTLDCRWISPPDRIRFAESKFHQLKAAPAFGFRVPRTLITNEPERAVQFFDELGGQVVNKVLAMGVVHQEGTAKAIYTRPVLREHLEHITSITPVPCVFQERIDKAFELRITVVGDQVFAAAIHSQATERTRHDWRRYDLENTPHHPFDLPLPVADACRAFVKSYGLSFGAIDMVVTPAQDYVFLELNPNGQWLWIEHLTGLPITAAVADLLTSEDGPDRGTRSPYGAPASSRKQ